ncbi:sulfotransferase family 2 domain-containing protein [Aureitalea sp. L0-47]|uniref:sulfotransferase family protein n=1 Tax=Aureitalea sp. L0-47 TaxID=2816962 RepID=UPI0022382017|nr:sulfotransferase family protein [Aureitalea sp. L0-47]MCW5519953.1 sulfotransferase family 2 domain-containing protein [Aureitalea sp. L0-47]
MISPKHHTIFVHIPKVAGQSIETIFLKDLGLNWKSREELLLRKKRTGEKGPHRLAHLKAKEYVSFGYTDQETYDAYFTFSFVRNPYNRLLSVYNYLGYFKIISFSAFMNKVVKSRLEESDFFYATQYDYLFDGEKLLVDYVGKLENLAEDMKFVLSKTGLESHEIPHVNKSEKGLKRGMAALLKSTKLWSSFSLTRLFSGKKKKSLTEAEKELVYSFYPKDFEKFGYER